MGMFSHLVPGARSVRAVQERSAVNMSVSQYLNLANASTFDQMDKHVAVGAAQDLIASLVSELPAEYFRGRGRDRVAIPEPSWMVDPSGDGYGLSSMVYQLVWSHLAWGNAWAMTLDTPSNGAYVTGLQLLPPGGVHPTNRSRDEPLSGGPPKWSYQIQGDMRGEATGWSPASRHEPGQVLHSRSYERTGELLGRSVIRHHYDLTILPSLEAARFGKKFFTDGGLPTSLFVNSEMELKDGPQVQRVKEQLIAKLYGSREPLVLGKGWDFKPMDIPPEDSQFLLTQQWGAAECARMYGPGVAEILGYSTDKSMMYKNVTATLEHLLVLSVNKWINRVERFLTMMTPRGVWVQLDRSAIMDTNVAQRYATWQKALSAGWMTPNEVREREDLPPAEWGDVPQKVAQLEAQEAAARVAAEQAEQANGQNMQEQESGEGDGRA